MSYIDKLLNEWAYRVHDGKPNPKNIDHIWQLRDILLEWEWDVPAINQFVYELKEAKERKNGEHWELPKDSTSGDWAGKNQKGEIEYYSGSNAESKAVEWAQGGKDDEEEDDGTAKDLANPETEKDAHDIQKSDSRGTKWDASYYGAEDSTEWEEHYREAEENGDEEALAQIKWFGEKQGWGEGGELPKTQKQKSEEVRAKIYKKPGTLIGDDPKLPADQSDREIKKLCLKWGYKKFEKNAKGADGKPKGKPAMGNAGSMFNEVISGEGTSILEQEPDLTEEELAQVLYDQFCGTTLGNEVKGSNLDTGIGVGDIPSDVTGSERGCYSKCLVTARSSKRKHQRVQDSVKSVRESGGDFDEPTKIHSFYGHGDSLKAQVAMIKNALSEKKKVYAPDGTLITEIMTDDELYKLILEGGQGGNPSDTATFVEDANGNLILNFTSDKMTPSDQQANSTLINEINNRKKTIEDLDPPLSDEDKQTANTEIDRHKEEVDVEQQKLKKIVAPVGVKMLEDIEDDPDALDDFIDEWESDGDGLATADHWEDWQESIAKDNDWTDRPLTQEQKRCAAKLLMKVTAGEADRPIDTKTDRPKRGGAPEVEVDGCKTKRWLSNNMAKIPARSAARRHKAGKEGYNIKEHIETIRRNIIRMERNHLAKLNKITVMVDGKEKKLGELIEGQQIVDQLHLQMMDGDEDSHSHPMMSHGLFEVNMGGHPVNKEVLQRCLADGDEDFDSKDFIAGFKVMAPDINEPGDRYTWSCNLPPKEPKPKDPKNPTKKENSAHKRWEKKWGKATNPELDESGEVTSSGKCNDGTPRRATGRVMFIYALVQKKDGETSLVKVAEKNMRTKTGDLGKYNTTVTYHDDMQKCIKEETDSA